MLTTAINLTCSYKGISIFHVPNVVFDDKFIFNVQHMKVAISKAKHIPVNTIDINIDYVGVNVLSMFGNISKN